MRRGKFINEKSFCCKKKLKFMICLCTVNEVAEHHKDYGGDESEMQFCCFAARALKSNFPIFPLFPSQRFYESLATLANANWMVFEGE